MRPRRPRELLLDACERDTEGVVLVVEAELDPLKPDILRHLVDVAQRSCWAASRQLEVTATNPDVWEALATVGIWPSMQSSSPGTASDEGVGRPCD